MGVRNNVRHFNELDDVLNEAIRIINLNKRTHLFNKLTKAKL